MVKKVDVERFINEDLKKIRESPISELNRKAKGYDDAISLGRGEPDFDMAEFMKGAMKKALDENKTHYAASGSIPGLNEAIAEKLKKKNGITVEPQFGVVVGAGSSPVLGAMFGAVFNPGEKIMLTDPTYLMYMTLAESMHIKPNFVHVVEGNNFAPSFEDMMKAHEKKTKAILINSPSNPTGSVYKKRQLEEVAKYAIEKDVLIFSDEIYEDIVYDGERHHSIASFDEDIAERTITVNGFSKSYAMTGLRVGYAAGPTELMKKVFNYNYFGHICGPVPSMYAALEGLTNPKTKKFIDDQVVEYDRRRKLIVKRLNEIGLTTRMPKGAFYAFARCDSFEQDSYKCVYDILEKTHVVCIPGIAFGPGGEGFIRFSYATNYDLISQAMDRLENHFK